MRVRCFHSILRLYDEYIMLLGCIVINLIFSPKN